MDKNQSAIDPAFSGVISAAIQIPGIKVNRETFLLDQLKPETPERSRVLIEKGPVGAGYPRSELKRLAHKLVNTRTITSSAVSFAAGIPGGLAMAGTVSADLVQFYAVALRLAQEIAYLYGEEDLWTSTSPDPKKVNDQLILYCGVMLGASGASQAVRLLSSSLSKQALKKLPQKALMSTLYYPIVKHIAKALGLRMTKSIFAKGVSKIIPIVGGVLSGGLTLATMRPMGIRLIDTLDEAHFSYLPANFSADWQDVHSIIAQAQAEEHLSPSPEAMDDSVI